jgi:hypothetical protein
VVMSSVERGSAAVSAVSVADSHSNTYSAGPVALAGNHSGYYGGARRGPATRES